MNSLDLTVSWGGNISDWEAYQELDKAGVVGAVVKRIVDHLKDVEHDLSEERAALAGYRQEIEERLEKLYGERALELEGFIAYLFDTDEWREAFATWQRLEAAKKHEESKMTGVTNEGS